ncbi:glycosyl transferase [Candidatus Zixiibacteriota bacterium]
MGDFYQSRTIATFHKLGNQNLADLESELITLSRRSHCTLVLPALYSEFEGDALPNIIDHLKGATYVDEIVLVLGRADAGQFAHSCASLTDLPQRVRVIWVNSPAVQDVLRTISERDLSIGESGKGQAVWIAYGYVLGRDESTVIAVHDCDILSYDRSLLARLVYPVMNRNLGFEFVKGYYARVTDRMYGRVTRLFITPVVRAMRELLGNRTFLNYLDDFRYPLAGEIAMSRELARLVRIPGGWGLEVATLAEVYRNVNPNRICQVDLADTYEHKHQPLSKGDPSAGLMKMCVDITRSILNTLASEGVSFGEGFYRSLQAAYLRHAQDTIRKCAGDAAVNGLFYDRHEEGLAVETFSKALMVGADAFTQNPDDPTEIPNWSRVSDALPDIQKQLVDVVESENQSG